MSDPQSIVHWFPEKDSQQCGYCKGSYGSIQYGMWAETLTVEDYQNLIDRGWRRSGQYCYKPVMDETCCPLYTIRCNTLEFRPSKSQKKVIKRANKFLKTGILKERGEQQNSEENMGQEEGIMDNYRECPNKEVDLKNFSQMVDESELGDQGIDMKSHGSKENKAEILPVVKCEENIEPASTSKSKPFKKGMGADPNKLPCKKAKVMRLEKKLKKLENSGQKIDQHVNQQQGKSLEEFMNEISGDDKHKLITKLIEPSKSVIEWKKYELLEFQLFKKYQIAIHNDAPNKNKMDGFRRFLVNTPLQRQHLRTSSESMAYGSYHHQYWLDDKLIAVGVIDILPKCVSAVYFFYDPDYRELTLGTFGALKEIQLARELFPSLGTQFYYMGYYIHNCIKMRYKGAMTPSFLLCPETYEWFPIEKCVEKLEKNKYSRLNDDLDALDANECTGDELDCIKIIVGKQFMTYKKFKRYYNQEAAYTNMGKLMGKICARNIFIIGS